MILYLSIKRVSLLVRLTLCYVVTKGVWHLICHISNRIHNATCHKACIYRPVTPSEYNDLPTLVIIYGYPSVPQPLAKCPWNTAAADIVRQH